MSPNFMPPDDLRRSAGLVYEDPALAQSPACHVLVVGVAAYQSEAFSETLDTASISARAIADWFVDPAKARFDNPDCHLGSVALVLSETANAQRATYAGGPVPRATFQETKSAVRAWLGRINAHKENLAVLYFVGHGESFLGRTGLLLEDFGTDAMDATAGMTEVEQFIGALENATPVEQLLFFDCCRNTSNAKLPWDETFGNKLIALTRQPNDHGEPRKQWAICSTSRGEYAGGFKTGRTLFNAALIDALNGVASDPTATGWPVRPGLLVDRIDKLLAMHRLPDEKAQTPAGRLAGSFDITFCGEAKDIPVYISLQDPSDWAESEIAIAIDGVAQASIQGKALESPFKVKRLAEGASLELTARRDGHDLGQARAKVRAPVTFVQIEKQPRSSVVSSVQVESTRVAEQPPRFAIEIASQVTVLKGALVTIAPKDAGGMFEWQQLSDIGGTTIVKMPVGQVFLPGDYTVTLRSPDGATRTVDTHIEAGQDQTIRFDLPNSPHEWMRFPVLTGSVQFLAAAADGGEAIPGPESCKAEIVGGLSIGLEALENRAQGLSLTLGSHDARFSEVKVMDGQPFRFRQGGHESPVFAKVSIGDDRVELTVVPSLGDAGGYERNYWRSHLVVDRSPRPQERMVTVAVESPKWAGLLGFLEARDAATGAKLLDERLYRSAIAAMHDKVSNPLAATAGALIAIGAADPDIEKRWDPWLRNIANWFGGLPDGPIILARRLLTRARTKAQIEEAKGWFVEGFRRGVPVFSLSVDWLARGLESIPDDGDEGLRMRAAARRLANRVDPTHAFTVIRTAG